MSDDIPEQTDNNVKKQRLPCRGCMTHCKNYALCEGKPWRQQPTAPTGVKLH